MYLTTEKIQPNPPFILIRAVALDPRDKTVNRLEKKFSDRNIRRRTLTIVYPPKDRVRDIADRFSDYLMDGTIGGTSNQFVSVARGIAIDLFATGRGASQNHRDGVTLFDLQAMPSKFYSFHRSAEVARRITGENVIRLLPALGKARALLRMFDRSSETYPPYGKLGHFPPQGGRFRVTVTLESPQKNALIEPRLYAYAGKTVVASLTLNEMNLSAGAVTMRGEITVDRPIDSFRVDLWSRVKIPGDFSAYVIRDVRFEALAPN